MQKDISILSFFFYFWSLSRIFGKLFGMENIDNAQERIKFIINHLEEKKGTNVLALDLRGISTVTDYMIIVDGFVNRHVSSMIKSVVEEVRVKFSEKPVKLEGMSSGEWVLVDFGDIIVHGFVPELRERYDLESLWSEGKQLSFT